MEIQPSLILSLRIRSSFDEHDYITELMQVENSLINEIGPPRKVREKRTITPQRQSWGVKILKQQRPNIAEAINEANKWVAKRDVALRKLGSEGKRFEYYIGVWISENVGAVLDVDTLKFLSEHEIEIGLDIYPRDDCDK